MKAMILAGGEGRRLRPMTCDTPKTLLRVGGQPILAHMLDWLAEQGAEEAVVVTRYQREQLQNFCAAQSSPLPVRCAAAEEAWRSLAEEETILLIGGDVMTDLALPALLACHRTAGDAVTAVICRRRTGHGIPAAAGPDGRLLTLGEPAETAGLMLAGICLVSPSRLPASAAEANGIAGLLASLLRADEPIRAYETEAFCFDIDTPADFLACQTALLAGECRRFHPASDRPAGRYTLRPPVWIGRHVQIGEGATLGPFAVLEDGCCVEAGAIVRGSTVGVNAYVGEEATLSGAILCHGATVKRGAALYEGTVAGCGSIVGEGATLCDGVKLWPGKTVDSRLRLTHDLRLGNGRPVLFEETGLSGEDVELTAEFCARLGMAVGSAVLSGTADNVRGKVAVATAGGPAAVLGAALKAGLIGTGCRVWDFGECIGPQFDYLVRGGGMSCGVYIGDGAAAGIRLVGADGCSAPRLLERETEARLASGEFVRASRHTWREPMQVPLASRLYRQELVRMTDGLVPQPVEVRGVDPAAVRLLSGVLAMAGCRRGEGLRLHLGPDARRLSIQDAQAGQVFPEQVVALNCLLALREGEELVLPPDVPEAIDRLAERFGGRVRRLRDGEAGTPPLWLRDGLMMAVRLLRALGGGESLASLLSELPAFSVMSRAVCCSGETAARLRELGLYTGEGTTRFRRENGTVRIRPSRSGRLLLLFAEADDSETAEELCGDVAGLLGGVPLDKAVKKR